MKPLYPLLLAGVLALAACGPTDTPNSSDAATTGPPVASPDRPAPVVPLSDSLISVLFFGDSITAAYGLDPDQSFVSVLQQRADSMGLLVRMINSGLSGETSAGGLRRISWVLAQDVDILVLELGGNDGLRGIDLADTRSNLQAIIDTTRARYPEVKVTIAGMMIPPSLGDAYATEFSDLFPTLASENQADLIPFLLDGVGGVDELMQSDGIHPNAAGNLIMAETVWQSLEPTLLELAAIKNGVRSTDRTP